MMIVMGDYERSLVERYRFARARMGGAPIPPKPRRKFGLPPRQERAWKPIKFHIVEEPVVAGSEYGWKVIAAQVALKYRTKIEALSGYGQNKELALARHELCYRLREERQFSWAQIGRFIHRDHTTALYGYRRHKARMAA